MMRYSLDIHLDVTVEELYELQLSLRQKLKSELTGRAVTEQKREEWVGKGSVEVDNVLLCELNACEIRIHMLEELISQIKIAAEAAQAQDNRVFRRAQKLKEDAAR